MTQKWIYVCIPLLMAGAVRLYPYLVSGLPFSLDAWGPIRNTELLLKRTPIGLGDDAFDGYNNYWPAISLFGAVVSEVTSLSPLQTMAIFIPMAGATTILIFYALVQRIFNTRIAFMASIIFATAFPHIYFTSGVMKETYANPLYLLLMLIFLHPTIGKLKQALLFGVSSVASALTHHFTLLIAIVTLSSITTAQLVSRTKRGLAPNKSDFFLTSILAVTATIYYIVYAYAGFQYSITYSDWLSAASFQILAFALALYLTHRPSAHTKTRTIITSLTATSLAFVFTLFIMSRPFVPGAAAVPQHYLLYNLPYVIAVPLITLGYRYQKQISATLTPMYWLAVIAGIECFALFSNSSLLSFVLATRGLGFLNPLMAIFSAAGLYCLYDIGKKRHSKKFTRFATGLALIVITTLSFYSMYATVSIQERYMGYAGLYRIEEFEGSKWITTNGNQQAVSGDWKVLNLIKHYFQVEVDYLQAFRYLNGETESQPRFLFIYNTMLKNGYLIVYQAYDLEERWPEKALQLNLIYSNSEATLYTQTKLGGT